MKSSTSPWTFGLFPIFGIPLRVHLTFAFLLGWLLLGDFGPAGSPLMTVLLIIAVFSSILIHEIGHALIGRHFGVVTRDITLYPFGGISSIGSEPSPKAEFWMAWAGPFVNLVLAGAISLGVNWEIFTDSSSLWGWAEKLFAINLGLGLFNLIPALPMDGGRILRSSMDMLHVARATEIASRVSQALCFVIGLAALYIDQPILLVIAFVLFFSAVQEYVRAEAKRAVLGLVVGDAIIPKSRLESIAHGTTIDRAATVALTSLQPVYPVLLGDSLLGIVLRDDLVRNAAMNEEGFVSSIMERVVPSININQPLGAALDMFDTTGSPVLVVDEESNFAGLLIKDRLLEFLMVTGLKRQNAGSDDPEWLFPS